MEFKNLKLSDSRVVTITDPTTGLNSDMTVELYGFHSDHFKKIGAEIYEANPEAKFDDSMSIELISKSVKTWANVTLDGKSIKPTLDNIKKFCIDYPWFKDQLEKEASRYKDFFN